MVPLKTPDILDCLAAIDDVRDPAVDLHLLGVTRVESMSSFATHGVVSFDSTSPFRQAFMDDRRNYHTIDDAYVAIRVPQVEGNPSLKRAVLSGRVSQREAVAAERDCLKTLRDYDTGAARIDETLDCLAAYEALDSATAQLPGGLSPDPPGQTVAILLMLTVRASWHRDRHLPRNRTQQAARLP